MSTAPFLAPGRDRRFVLGRAKGGGTTHYSLPGIAAGVQTTTRSYTLNNDYYSAFVTLTPIVFDQAATEVTASPGGSNQMRIGLYAADPDLQPLGAPLMDSGDIDVSSTGIKTYTPSTPVYLPPGSYLTILNHNGSGTLTCQITGSTAPLSLVSTLGASPIIDRMSVARTYAAFPTPGTAWTSVSNISTRGFSHPIVFRITAL